MKFIVCSLINFYKKLILLLLLFLSFSFIQAVDLIVNVKDQDNKPLLNAVVYAEPIKPIIPKKLHGKGVVYQNNKELKPHVSVFQKGVAVTFANKDPHKHHVYSFSKAKKFEIKLYSDEPPRPIVFKKTGPVTLGCNIPVKPKWRVYRKRGVEPANYDDTPVL